MKNIKFLLLGFLFGIFIVKSEALSWFRIQEMFRFQSFHMYGLFAGGVAVGALAVWLIRKYDLKSVNQEPIKVQPKPLNKVGNVIGGMFFGGGWALTGLCVAPVYAFIGSGYTAAGLVILVSALAGTFIYAILRDRLPH